MTILGIDYGRAKVGLAIATALVAEPYEVIRYYDIKILWETLGEIIEKENVDRVIVGVSEGKMGEEAKDFGLSLRKKLAIPVETFDETLSTQEAQLLAIEAGLSRKKRKGLEDAYSATLILQGYLDSI